MAMENMSDLAKSLLNTVAEKEKSKPFDSELSYVAELIKNYVGDADWKKSQKNYEQLMALYKEKGKLEQLKTIIGDCKMSKARNRGAYINSAMRNGLGIEKNSSSAKSNGMKLINANYAEVNPAWALERPIKGKRTVIINNDEGNYTVTIQNVKNDINPVKKTMQLYYEVERIYADKSCPNSAVIEISAADLLTRLGWPASGQSYDDLEEHLETLLNTQIHSDGVYKYKEKGVIKEIPRTTAFNMIAGYDFFNEKDATKPIKKIKISLNPIMAQNVKENYYFLNAGPGKKLTGAVEMFLYDFLIKRKGKDKNHTHLLDINEVANHIGIYTTEIRERRRSIKEALKSFEEKKLIKSFEMADGSQNFKVYF
jgi:hypothetical protein